VAAGDGLVLIDADEEPLLGWLRSHLPKTLTVKSPGHNAPHFYLMVYGDDRSIENKVLYWGYDNKGQRKEVGHVQAHRKYLVGPGSIHPNGGVYKILDDRPIALMEWKLLLALLKPFLKEKIEAAEQAAVEEKRQSNVDLNILDVVPLAGLKKQGNEYYGPHPVHGSTTGRNFWVNTTKNCWHCFRHSSGGGPLLWLAVEEGIIDCSGAGPGALRGDLFKRVLEKAVERGLADLSRSIDQKGKEEEKKPLVDQLIEIALSGATFFEDERGDAFALLEGGGHFEVHRVEGRSFERWLRKKYYELKQRGLRKEIINDVCSTLAAIAQFQEPRVRRTLYNRVAWYKGSIYYDIADEKWRTIKISPDGWEIMKNPPPLFRRFPHQEAQVEPIEGGSLEELFELINVTDPEDQMLVKVYIVTLLVPDIPHPILLVIGPQGCGKSDLMKVIRILVDPSTVLLQSFRYDELEMALKIYQHYVVYFDNLSSIKQWLSDVLCRACTGEGFTKRRLYTDEDSVVFRFRRCVGVNGIVLSQLSPDFLDRCLTLRLKQIDQSKRLDEKKLWNRLEEVKPRLFGAILDTLSKAMTIYPTVEIEHLPRMADFAIWGEAVARALGYKPGEFLRAYRKKIGEQTRDVIEENPIGLAILAFMENKLRWEGTPGELLSLLEDDDFARAHNIDTKTERWPRSANWVTRRIKEIETNLEHEGIKFLTRREKRRRIITLIKGDGSDGISPNKRGDRSGELQHGNVEKKKLKRESQRVLVNKNNTDSGKVNTRNAVTAVIPSPHEAGDKIKTLFTHFPPENLLRSILVGAGGEIGVFELKYRLERLGFSVSDLEELRRLESDGKIIVGRDTIGLGPVWADRKPGGGGND